MRKYKYTARNRNGDLVKGVVFGESETECIQQLRLKQVYPIQLRAVLTVKGRWLLRQRSVSYQEIGVFCKQFSTLLRAGISIPQALRLLSIQQRSSKLQGILYELFQALEQGESLYQGFIKHDQKLPDFFSALIRAGEMTNRLELVLDRLATYYHEEDEFRKQIQQMMIYPFILFLSTLGVIFFIFFEIIPGFEEIYNSFEANLPFITYCLLAISEYLCVYYKKYLIGFLLCMLILSFVFKFSSIKKWLSIYQYKIPIVGKVKQRLIIARLARTWNLLLENGLEVLPAIELTSETVGQVLASYLQKVSSSLKKGVSLTHSLRQISFFPELFLEMVNVGEESGSLASMLGRVAEIYENEGKNQIQRLITILEPILLLSIALIVGIIIMAIMLPMFNMIKLI